MASSSSAAESLPPAMPSGKMPDRSSSSSSKETVKSATPMVRRRESRKKPGLYNVSSVQYTRWMKEGREVLGTPAYTVYSLLISEKMRLNTGDSIVLPCSRESRLVCGLVLERSMSSRTLSIFTDRFDTIPISSHLYRLHASRKEQILCYQQTI